MSVFAPDRPGLFYRITAGLAAAGASVVDARIHTTRDGMALDNLLVTDARGLGYGDARLRKRLVRGVEAAIDGAMPPPPSAATLSRREEAFAVAPSVLIAEKASTRTTVIEVNARDRQGLLVSLAFAIHSAGHMLHSAHIATYGERAVDVFYVTADDGRKLDAGQIAGLRAALLAAAA